MTIPAAFTRDPVTLHATETHVEVFEATRPYVVHAWSAVGRRRTLVEAPHWPVSTQFIDSGDEAQFFPSRQCSLLQSGRSEVRGNIWKRHCWIIPAGDNFGTLAVAPAQTITTAAPQASASARTPIRPRGQRTLRGRQLQQTTEPSLVWASPAARRPHTPACNSWRTTTPPTPASN